MVVLDTNIIIDALRLKTGQTVLGKILQSVKKSELGISFITVQELYQGKSVEDFAREEELEAVIFPLRFLPYSFEVAKRAGEIVRASNYSVPFADAAIAATTIINGAELATLNPKDFQGIKGLGIYKVA